MSVGGALRCGRSSSSRTRLRRAAFLCAVLARSLFCVWWYVSWHNSTYSAVPTRVEMRRSVGGELMTITYTRKRESRAVKQQQKKKREQRRQEQCESLFEQCVFAEGVQCAGSVWKFSCARLNGSCEVEQRMVVWRVERCD